MKIDNSRYSLFWSSPEKYRLREIWKLAPIEPKADTFASLLTYGRRRGTCFHELLDAKYRGVGEYEAIQSLKDGGFGDKEIEAAKRMAGRVRDVYGDEKYLAHETLFEAPIPESPHTMVGRIDHILEREGKLLVGDWKTSKRRTKSDAASKAADYCRSSQVPFYLIGARKLGFQPAGFLYRLVQSGTDTSGVSITEHITGRTNLGLTGFARGVHITCELILWMKAAFGIEKPWPHIAGPFDSEYESIIGTKQYEGYIPEGYQPKVEHLELMKEANVA